MQVGAALLCFVIIKWQSLLLWRCCYIAVTSSRPACSNQNKISGRSNAFKRSDATQNSIRCSDLVLLEGAAKSMIGAPRGSLFYFQDSMCTLEVQTSWLVKPAEQSLFLSVWSQFPSPGSSCTYCLKVSSSNLRYSYCVPAQPSRESKPSLHIADFVWILGGYFEASDFLFVTSCKLKADQHLSWESLLCLLISQACDCMEKTGLHQKSCLHSTNPINIHMLPVRRQTVWQLVGAKACPTRGTEKQETNRQNWGWPVFRAGPVPGMIAAVINHCPS